MNNESKAELEKILKKFEDYMECDEWHIHVSGDGYEANSDPLDGHVDFDRDKAFASIEKIVLRERMDELKRACYPDKIPDSGYNPLNNMFQRLAALQAELGEK